jgi:holo-[acyl-carrier protein] synthase
MQIFGIGIDVVEVDRIEESIAKFGDHFLGRIFTDAERSYCEAQKRPALNYAARFAVKEAVAKSFGTGIGKELAWLDMSVSKAASGEPQLQLSGNGAAFAESKQIALVKISLTHAKHYAAANAIALQAL